MKKIVLLLLGWALITTANAQRADAIENKSLPLSERFYLMKTQSQTFQDYKVIKEYIIDGVWKICLDSVSTLKNSIVQNKKSIDSLKKELEVTKSSLESKTNSMADIVFASDHISAFGKDFTKSAFLILVSLLAVFLLVGIALLILRMSEMERFVKESKLIISNINHEFDDYKHKTVEKQIKLARELQTERNKLQELKLHKNH
ncbi:MAG: hypothetical protein QM734_09925 [Cyclobacteriaceae bacterium]